MPVLKVFKDGAWQNITSDGVSSWNDLTDKPFGDDGVIKEKGEEILSVSYDFVTGNNGEIFYSEDSDFVITEGETYFVDYDGTTYECMAYLANAGSNDEPDYLPVIGNVEIVGMSGGNAEPFFIGTNRGEIFVYVQTEGTHDVALYTCIESSGIKKLDKKYLPEISWNDLVDKPFYDETVRNDIFSVSHEFVTDSEGNMTPYTESSTFAFVEGNTYFVDYDEATYECVAYYAEGPNTACVGNGTIGDVIGGGNEPFFAIVYNGEIMIFSETEGVHTISVYVMSGSIKKIDEKYLPDNIGGGVSSWNDLTDKPFIPETIYIEWREDMSYDTVITAEGGKYVKISDETYNSSSLLGKYAVVEFSTGESQSMLIESSSIQENESLFSIAGLLIVILSDSYETPVGTLTKGAWALISDDYGFACLKICDPAKTIDESVIPDTIARTSQIEHYTYGTEDLVAGESALATGKLYFVYAE